MTRRRGVQPPTSGARTLTMRSATWSALRTSSGNLATSVSDEGHPTRALLVLEAAGESLAYDRSVKGALYARAGIPEYWVINVPEECIEVFREPDSNLGGYQSATTFGHGEKVTSAVLPGLSVAVDELFA